MLVLFSPIFVADTKIIFRYDFVAPLKQLKALVRRRILGLGNLFRNCNVKVETVADQNFVKLK